MASHPYLYILSYKNSVFYVGITSYPALRYQQHCCDKLVLTYEFIYWLLAKGERPDISIINRFIDKSAAAESERSLINYFVSIGNKLCNHEGNPIHNRIITCRPIKEGNRRFTGIDYKKIVNESIQQYYKRYRFLRHDHLGNAVGFS